MSQQPPQPPPSYYYPPPPKPGMSTGAKVVLIVIIGCCVLTGGCVACFTLLMDSSTKKLNRNSDASNTPMRSTPPASVNTNSSSNANVKVSAKQKAADAADLRFQLEGQYRDVMAKANPHLNYIESKTTKVKGGYAIWAVHTYFSSYSFKIGSDARVTSDWIIANWSALHNANVVQVGLKSDNGYGGWCSLKVD